MVVLAAGDELTGVDKETGAVRWRKTLPFAPDLVAGDDRTLVAGSSSGPCPVTALSVETGAVLWNRSFAQDPRFAGDRLQRMTLTTEPATLRLYWGKALLAGETRRPAEAIVDPASGATRDVRAFGPLETDWPAEITLGPDSRTDLAPQTTVPRPSRGPFRPDAFAYVGKEAIARFALREGGADLAPGWNPRAEGRWGGQYATPAGAYVKRPGQLAFFDAQARREILFDLPRTPDRAPASGIADFREGPGETLTVVSAAPGSFRPWGFGAIVKTGLRDDAGTGNVTLTAFDPGGAQIGIYCRRLPEAGINPIATLHNWGASEAYRRQHMAMKGISSLGWTKYDIFLYGASGKGTVTINGGRPQEHQGTDFSNPLHRTTFIRGVNYVKVEGVTGDEFLLCYEWDCSGLQIVDASGGAGPRRSLAVRWTTSGPAFRPDEKFGVEVAAGNWYTINKHFALLGGYQADKGPGVIAFVDVFDRKSGKLLGSHPLPSTQPAPPPAPYDGQAKLLDEALLVTDVNGFYVFGSAR
ncbi:MAG: PQQ-binding-like beta-propeller repeat protein [Planctomycetota bacterium]|nr:PQQ-binding-like beta-propeller repeat protein [Planctomycetota bacterium]